MITIFSLTRPIRWTRDGILEKLWLLNFSGVLTNFLQILHCFFICLYRFSCIASVKRRRKKKTRAGGCMFQWGLEMKQYSKATGQRVFALHMLFQVPIWRPFWKCQIDRFDHANLVDFLQKFESIIMLLDSITGHLRIVTHYHRTVNLRLSIYLETEPLRYRRISQADWDRIWTPYRSILRTVLLKRSKTQDFAGKLDSKKR